MSFTPERAATRFGCGLSPRQAAPASVDDMLGALTGPDVAALEFPIAGMDPVYANLLAERDARRTYRKAKTDEDREAASKALQKTRRALRIEAAGWFGHTLLRRAQTPDGFRERLVAFWTDHFTAQGKVQSLILSQANYAEEAIRPHITGRFADMLRATTTHPLMLHYLDQITSVGPNSRAGQRNPDRGLNENLAREVLELHTLGVGGPYTQTDVRAFAKLLTGLGFDYKRGFRFRAAASEPGQHEVLGGSYDGGRGLNAIHDALDDLATHSATARHIAGKLAVHFVGDAPDPALVVALETRFAETGGDLMAVYEALLTHPAAWGDGPGNVKQPIDFIGSSLRALDVQPRQMPLKRLGRMRRFFYDPLTLMGQTWGRPSGPDGWPEADEDWITPARLAARLQWAMFTPLRLRRTLPDPREFVDVALGGLAPDQVRFAAKAAETRPEGIGIVLSSAAFQRM
ncbi:MAG: DUF1800 domain-containing protein [Pseudomonadota bacterium]